jgi:predicted nucleic-acid-binding protein
MRAADTNVVVRVTVRDDAKQVAIAEAFIERGAWVSTLVLAETLWVLRMVYGLTHAELVRTIESLLVHAQFVLQDADAVAAALVHFKRSSKNGFSDYFILELARKNGHTPFGTFVKALAKIEGVQKL